jgi:hypothetical protein
MNTKSKEALIQEFTAEKIKLKKEIQEENELLGPQRIKKLHEVAQVTMKKEYFLGRDFYMVLVITNETTPDKKPRDDILLRRTPPTPGYNQNVFKYHHQSNTLEYLWTIPKQHIYWNLYAHRSYYLQDPALKKLTSFVCMMESGDLEKWVRKENKEFTEPSRAVIQINDPLRLQKILSPSI